MIPLYENGLLSNYSLNLVKLGIDGKNNHLNRPVVTVEVTPESDETPAPKSNSLAGVKPKAAKSMREDEAVVALGLPSVTETADSRESPDGRAWPPQGKHIP